MFDSKMRTSQGLGGDGLITPPTYRSHVGALMVAYRSNQHAG